MPGTQIRLLGRFEARKQTGGALSAPGRQSIALLACLASPKRAPATRQELASLVWSDRGRDQAMASLRQELLRLRKTLGPDCIINADQTTGGSPSLNAEVLDVDLVDFENASATQEARKAVALYRGPLLSDFPVRERDAFSSWLKEQRAHIAEKAAGVLLQTLYGPEANTAIARRILEIDPRCEEAWRFLIHHHAARGEASALEDTFAACVKTLDEIGATPSAETTSLVELARAELAVSVVNQFRHASNDAGSRTVDWTRVLRRAPLVIITDGGSPTPVDERPSIAVMPFELLNDETAKPGFARALTDDITQALCRMPGFFVTARQSAEAVAREGLDARKAAGALGVRYLIEGGVEHESKRIRVNLRLIDGASGLHLWGERIEEQQVDGLHVRDAAVRAIVGRLQPRLISAEVDRALRLPPADHAAWDLMMKAAGMMYSSFAPDGDPTAPVILLENAIEQDPQSGMAHAMLSAMLTLQSLYRVKSGKLTRRWRARRHMERALQLDPENAFVLSACAETALYMLGDIDRALSLVESALRSDPNDPSALAMLGHLRRMSGDSAQAALSLIAQALRLSPRDPRRGIWYHYEAWCHWKANDFIEMERSSRRSLEVYRAFPWSWVALTCALGLQGRWREAHQAGTVLRDLMPMFSGFIFYMMARVMYGRRFQGDTREGYRQLRAILERAIAREAGRAQAP